MDTQYKTGSASLFATAARPAGIYVAHYDHPAQQWNVFQKLNGAEYFVCSFLEAEGATAFCASMNGEVK